MMSNEHWSGRVEGIQAIRKELVGKRLTSFEKKVLILRYGIDISREQTLAQVGHTLRLHPQRIHKIEVDALKKLRTHPKLQHLRDYLN